MNKQFTGVKQSVSKLITDVLHVGEMSIDEYDNLVELGVDSLLMMDINSKLNYKYGVQIQISQFFGGMNTIADIVQYVIENSNNISGVEAVMEEVKPTNVNAVVTQAEQNNSYVHNPYTYLPPNSQDALMQQISNVVYQVIMNNQIGVNTAAPNANSQVGYSKDVPKEEVNNEIALKMENPENENNKKPYVAYKKIDSNRKEHTQKVKQAIDELTEEYNGRTKRSKEFAEKIRSNHADWRNVAGFRMDYKELVYQLVAQDCSGSRITDIDGNEYIDIAMGFGVNFFGYKPDFVLDAVKAEIDTGFPLSMISDNLDAVTGLICEMTDMERVAYFNSGSEAVMVAIRVARAKTLKKKIVYFSGAYHGTFDGVLGIKGTDYNKTHPMAIGIIDSMIDDIIVLDYDDKNSLKIIEENADNIAGVLLEAVQSRRPGLQPREFVVELRRITKEKDIALIFDEMITGFRISAGGAQEFYGVKGDIATYGKIVGGGMPIGVVAGTAEFMDCLDGGMWSYGDDSFPPMESHRTFAGGTFCHHPLSMAAAKAVLTKIKNEKDTIYPEINRKTIYLADELNAFFERENAPIRVTYFGSLFRFEFQGNLEVFYYYMLMHGIYIWEGRNCFLSTAHTDEDVNQIIAVVKKVVKKMQGVFIQTPPRKLPLAVSKQQATMIASMSFDNASSQYHQNALFETTSDFQEIIFTEAVKKVIERHQSLNVCLNKDNSNFNLVENEFKLINYKFDTDIGEEDIKKIINEPFDLYKERGFRIYQINDLSTVYILFVAHHLFIDGYSLIQMMEEILGYYNAALSATSTLKLKNVLSIQDFEIRKSELIQTLDQEEVKNHWENYLGHTYKLELPHTIEEKGNRGRRLSVHLNKMQYFDIKTAASRFNCTPFVLMLSVAHILLNKISNQKKVTIGVPFAGQLLTNDCSMIGYIDKIVPVVTDVFPEFRLKDIIYQNMNLYSKLSDYKYMFEEVCDESTLLSMPDINVLFNMDTLPELDMEGKEIRVQSFMQEHVMYDLMINLTLMGNEIKIDFDYNCNKFSDNQVEQWLNGYSKVLSAFISGNNSNISSINCINIEDEKQLTSLVKKIDNSKSVFVNEVANLSDSDHSYVIVDPYHNLMMLGSMGIIGIYSPNRKLYLTSYYGRITNEYELEIIDKRENTFILDGLVISKTKIESVIKNINGVMDAVITLNEKKQIIADIYCNDNISIIPSELNSICRNNLPIYMCPNEFYVVKNGTRTLFVQNDLSMRETEISEICSDILGLSNVGAEEDLIALGANSIKILKFFSSIQDIYGVRLTFSAFLNGFTIANISKGIEELLTNADISENIIEIIPKKDYYIASSAQQRLFIEYQLNSESVIYNIPAILYFNGDVSAEKIKLAFAKIIERHEILRTYFSIIDGEIVQIVSEKGDFEFNVIETNQDVIEESYVEDKMKQFIRPFQLEKLPLIRIVVLNSNQNKSVMLFDIHHIIFDGFSEGILMKELIAFLKEEELPELSIQYKDYSQWQKNRLSDSVLLQQETYWKDRFADGMSNCKLESDFMEIKNEIDKRGRCSVVLNGSQSQQINDFCKEINCTPSIFMFSVFGYVLKLHLYSDNVLLGVTLEGRNHYQIQDVIGFFVTNLPFKIEFNAENTVKDYIQSIKSEFYDFMDNSDVPLERIMEISGRKRTNKEQNLFDINFTYQDFYEEYYVGSTEIIPIEYSVNNNMFDLDCEIINEEGNFNVILKYNKNLYLEATINRILQHFLQCTVEFRQNYKNELSSVNIMDGMEREKILGEFNSTYTDYPKDKTVVDLFDEQVAKTPNNIAVVFNDIQLTYQELKEKSDSLAYKLRELGVENNNCIAIMSERGIELMIGICAIIKAGGAYVPIDPAYPEDRIQYILDDCKPKVLLVYHKEFETEIPQIDLADKQLYTRKVTDRISKGSPDDLVYVIYTSGTEGKPKGSLIVHKGVVRLVKNMNYIDLGEHTTLMQTCSISFDVSTFEIWGTLLNGGKLVLSQSNAITNPSLMRETLEKNRVNTMWLTSSLFNQMLLMDESMFDQLEYLLIGGEKLSDDHVRRFKSRKTGVRLINGYGPTENTSFTTAYEIPEQPDKVYIGKPIANTQVYIMLEDRLCGIGIPGELCTSGDGISIGYLNRPDLTAEKFIENPFGEGKLYRTGDLAKWAEDGNIEYLGRIDDQVKIRGFRIELGEIESRIGEIEAVKDRAVIAKANKNGDKAIYAYYVSDSKVSTEAMKDSLRKVLPAYMIPSYFMQVDSIPVTTNGKLNKKALPEIEDSNNSEYVAPRNRVETIICRVYEQILGINEVGIYDNFFEIGGHSLNAIRVINQIDVELGVRITLDMLLEYQSAKALAEKISASEGNCDNILAAMERDYYPMSSAQKRLFVISQLDDTALPYNMPGSVELGESIDVDKLRSAIVKLTERHEMLRTSFEMIDNEPVQIIHRETVIDFTTINAAESEIDGIFKSFVRAFDLGKAPLMRILLAYVSNKRYIMFIDMHHMISDGTSNTVLLNELFKLYESEKLNPLRVQYKDYSEWMRKRDLSKQKDYWVKEFSDEIPVLNMPLDFTRPREQSYRGKTYNIKTGTSLGKQIKELTRINKATDYMVFLSAAMVLLSKYSRQEDIVIGTPIGGRTHRDTETMVGMFVNTLAMRGKPEKKLRYREFLEKVKANCLKAYANQEYAFEELVESVGVLRDMSRNPLFDVMLELQNTERPEMRLEGNPLEVVEWEDSVAKFDLTFSIEEIKENNYNIKLEYCIDLFKQETIERIAMHYIEVLKQLTEDSEKRIEEIEVITEAEKTQILDEFNNTETEYQRDRTVVDLFEEQVNRTPNNIAVVYEDKGLTYRELNERANGLAYELRQLGVKANDFVVIIGERCNELMVGLYGILKSGGAYVPVNVSYPDDRIEYIIEDCQPKVVIIISDEIITANISVPVIHLKERILREIPENPDRIHTADNYSHCFYTSGTTGKPKGAVNLHRGLVNRILWTQSKYPIGETDVMLQKTTITFDDSLCELLWWSFFGAKLIMLENEGEKDPLAMCRAIEENKVTVMYIVPTVLGFFMDTVNNSNLHESIQSLRYTFVSGEELKPEHVRDFHRMTAKMGVDIPLINTYGPTEASIDCTYFLCDQDYEEIPIGRPMSNTQMYILQDNQLCGIGVPGELCVGGIFVGAGYLNREELTSQVFVKNPFAEGMMYRTGDLAQWISDGNIRFLGRMDEQIKIHGQRVELGEIESKIREIDQVKDCTVIAKTDTSGAKALYAYIVSEVKLDIGSIRETLSKVLPDYMVPTYIMLIDKIPATRNGKVDRHALPDIKLESTKEYIAPSNDEEIALQAAFSSVIEVSPISVDDNFFVLGGDSIKAIRIVSKVRDLGYELTVKYIMKEKTIRLIAPYLQRIDQVKYEQEELSGLVEYMPAQRELLDENLNEPNYYNQSLFFEFNGHVDEGALRKTMSAIITHHDALRAVYYDGKQEIKNVQDSHLFDLFFVDLQNRDVSCDYVEQRCNIIQKSMDLEHGPLVKVCVFKKEPNDHILFCIHHLVVDGISWRILLEDINSVYTAALKGENRILPSKTASVKEWTRYLKKYSESKKSTKERAYWSEVVKRIPESRMNINKNVNESGYTNVTFTIDKSYYKKLQSANQAYGTDIQDLFLSALSEAVREMTGQDYLAVELEGHGREELYGKIDVDRTVGFFTSTYPAILASGDRISETITLNKEMLRTVPNNGAGYGLFKNEQYKADILFNYLGNYNELISGNHILLQLSEYSFGLEISENNAQSHLISINSHIDNEEVIFDIIHSNMFDAKDMEQFIVNYKRSVMEIIDHCYSADRVTMTGSDFGDSSISMEDLGTLDELLKSL